MKTFNRSRIKSVLATMLACAITALGLGLAYGQWPKAEDFVSEAGKLLGERKYEEALEKIQEAQKLIESSGEETALTNLQNAIKGLERLIEIRQTQYEVDKVQELHEGTSEQLRDAYGILRFGAVPQTIYSAVASEKQHSGVVSENAILDHDFEEKLGEVDGQRAYSQRQNGESQRRPGDILVVRIGDVDTVFRWCPPGEFMMGSPTSEEGRANNEDQHKVKLTKGFWLCEVPVSVSEFRRFVDVTGYKTEAQKESDRYNWGRTGWRNRLFRQSSDHPVVFVSWNDAQAYVDWANENYAPSGMKFRLPSEAHWEYACRAGSQTAYWWSDSPGDGQGKANVGDESARMVLSIQISFPFADRFMFTAPVGCFEANAWGLKDMIGNVWEWCQDWYIKSPYPTDEVTDPTGPQNGSNRVIRGGGWVSTQKDCRSARRCGTAPNRRTASLGFRLELGDD